QLLDDAFALFVSTFSELVVPNSSVRIGDVHGRPVVIAEGLPNCIVAVECDRILDPHLLRGLADVVNVAFERKLGGMDADHDQPLIVVLLGPRADVAERAQPVDAGVRPEVDEDDLAAQVRGAEGRRVEPPGCPVEFCELPLDRQRTRFVGVSLAEQAHLSDPNAARTSLEKSSGSSQAAKWPPRSALLKYVRLGYDCSTQLRGARKISSGNVVKPTGIETSGGAWPAARA